MVNLQQAIRRQPLVTDGNLSAPQEPVQNGFGGSTTVGNSNPLQQAIQGPSKSPTTPQTGGVEDFVGQFTHLPWVGNDPSYWHKVINKNGGLTDENKAYWATRMTDAPNTGSNAANREHQQMGQMGMMGPSPSIMPPPIGMGQPPPDLSGYQSMTLQLQQQPEQNDIVKQLMAAIYGGQQ